MTFEITKIAQLEKENVNLKEEREITVTSSKIFCPKCDQPIKIHNHTTLISPDYQLEQYKSTLDEIKETYWNGTEHELFDLMDKLLAKREDK
jgi:hypothetical protein